jgi:hypothetical protein
LNSAIKKQYLNNNGIVYFSFLNMTEDDEEDYNDAAFFLIELHDDLGEPKEQLGIEMERVSIFCV